MMKCRSCGAELQGTEKFCGACGTQVALPDAPAAQTVPELTLTPEMPAVPDAPAVKAERDVPAAAEQAAPELTLTPPETLLREQEAAAAVPETVPTAAQAVMDREPPQAPGAAPMPVFREEPHGAPAQTAQQTQQRTAYAAPNPASGARPAYNDPQRPDRVLSMWGYVLSLFLMSLPIAGLVLQIVWTCGGTNSLNRRNLARGYLFLSVISFVIGLLIFVVLFAAFSAVFMDEFRYLF